MAVGLPDFFRYNLWANLRLLDACAQLSDAQMDATAQGTFGSVRETLRHMIASEEGYAQAVTGSLPGPLLRDQPQFPGFDELRRRVTLSGEALIAFAERAEQEDLDRILHLDGGTYDASVTIELIQVINHGVDHRSQIATLLSQQDVTPPDLDGWSYNDALR